MALGAVLVDRARLRRKEAAAQRVEGTTRMANVTGPWFRCRLFLPAGNESMAPSPPGGGGRRKVIEVPTLLYAKKDSEGGPIELNFDDELEVDSGLDQAVYKIAQQPEIIRRKGRNSVIGHQVQLQRVREGSFEEVGV